MLVNNVSVDNKNRLHWHHVSLLVYCSDGTTFSREAQINSTNPYVSKPVIERCRQQIINETELAESASIQAISYIGCMTNAEFFGKPTDGYAH